MAKWHYNSIDRFPAQPAVSRRRRQMSRVRAIHPVVLDRTAARAYVLNETWQVLFRQVHGGSGRDMEMTVRSRGLRTDKARRDACGAGNGTAR